MKKLLNFLFSTQLMGILMISFAVSIAAATFIENDFGTQSAKAVVYNARWFELILLLLAINLTGSIFTRKLYRKEKLPVFLFHFSFLLIFIGAAITRYISFEGNMHIRENESSNRIISDQTFITLTARSGDEEINYSKAVLLSPVTKARFHKKLQIDGKEVSVKLIKYIPKATTQLVPASDNTGSNYLKIVAFSGSQREDLTLKEGEFLALDSLTIGYNTDSDSYDLNIQDSGDSLIAVSKKEVNYLKMMGNQQGVLPVDSVFKIETRVLYSIQNTQFVISERYQNARTELVSLAAHKNAQFPDGLIFQVSSGDETKEVQVMGRKNEVGTPTSVDIHGINLSLAYGSIYYTLPFSLKLVDFQLERYPGSNSPSSYASEIILSDPEKNIEMPYRIYMNHVLNHRGYRFFQSSYDRDEKGTILSVNHDALGTTVTYIGYLLMSLGMILTLISKHSRFVFVLKRSSEVRKKRLNTAIITGLMVLALPAFSFAIDMDSLTQKAVSREFAEKFGKSILVQDHNGRIKPLNTLSSEVLRKISRKTSFYGLTPDQVLLEMMIDPGTWDKVPMIKVTHEALKSRLNVTGKYAAFNQIVDFTNPDNVYKINDLVQQAYAKDASKRNKFDKDVMQVDERVNIMYMIFTQNFLNIFPVPNHPNQKWVSLSDAKTFFKGDDSMFVHTILTGLVQEINKAKVSGDYSTAEELLDGLVKFQKKYGSSLMPSQTKINLEVKYNKWNIFNKLEAWYGLIGFILLVLQFITILAPRLKVKPIVTVFSVVVVILFIAHTAGLGLRWYIAGHAPWSNAYESMVFIAWATILAGIIFARRAPITLTSTALLASLILSVAHLNWLDPEITNLVPVLKSYWLIIHVAIITSSYGFLALGALLGFFSLIIMILKNRKNKDRLDLTIQEFTLINETTLEVGLILLTIGTFLGGVWANESWGRYWGWDPKETWALISVLVYSFILHMRLIPGLKGIFAFNFASIIGYSSILMTYFGVNYYLSGLHSYASGDPVPVPSFVYYTLAVIAVTSIWAYLNEQRLEKKSAS